MNFHQKDSFIAEFTSYKGDMMKELALI